MHIFISYRESEGSFQYGNYCREAEDLHFVVEHFRKGQCIIEAIIGHSKGSIDMSNVNTFSEFLNCFLFPYI